MDLGHTLGKGFMLFDSYNNVEPIVSKLMKGKKLSGSPAAFSEHMQGLGAQPNLPELPSCPKLSSAKGPAMKKTLAQALIDKIKTAHKKTITVTSSDVEFVDKIASAFMKDSMEKTAGMFDGGGLISKLIGGAAAGKAAAPAAEGALGIAGKKGFFGDLGSNFMSILQPMALGGTALMGANAIYNKLDEHSRSSAAYDQMFEEFPQLKEAPREQVDKYWQVLKDFAPALTVNPLVSGQFVANMMNYGMQGVDHNTVGQLIGFQNQANNASGFSNVMGLLGQAVKPSMDMTMTHDQTALAGGLADHRVPPPPPDTLNIPTGLLGALVNMVPGRRP